MLSRDICRFVYLGRISILETTPRAIIGFSATDPPDLPPHLPIHPEPEHSSDQVVATLSRVADEMDAIGGARIRKVARYLRNRAVGLGRYLDDLGQRVAQVTSDAGGTTVVDAVVRAYQANLLVGRSCPNWEQKERQQELNEAAEHLLNVTGWDRGRISRAMNAVFPVLLQRYRASSAIENLSGRSQERASGLPQPLPILLEHPQTRVGAREGHLGV